MTAPSSAEQRILILSPRGRDAQVIRSTLEHDGFDCAITPSLAELADQIRAGAGAAIVAEEGIDDAGLDGLLAYLDEQPPWSDFPFVVLASKAVGPAQERTRSRAMHLGNVILLERPLNAHTLKTSAASVLRGRRRQYHARAEIAGRMQAALELRQSQQELMTLNETLETRIEERTRALASANDRLMNEMFERDRVQKAMVQFQKMEAVGRLTGGIAHDFNNLLNVVQGSMDLILLLSHDEAAKKRAEVARSACRRGAKLTNQLLAFARNQSLDLRATGVGALFEGTRELIGASIGSRIALSWVVEPPAISVMADYNQLEMALLNLAINARDAMPQGGQLSFSAGVATPPPELLPPGDYVCIAVRDSGAGMKSEVAERVFEPFFTTKPVGKGTGLGLSQVYGMAQQSGGAARIHSEEGAGTTVEIWLRAGQSATVTAPSAPALSGTAVQPGTRVLIIEDDDFVRQCMAESLAALGYEVDQASDGEQGLRALRRARPHLMITDYLMPGMTGAQLLREAKAEFPDLPMVIATGYADMKAVAEVIGENEILRKPYALDELAQLVERLLQERLTVS